MPNPWPMARTIEKFTEDARRVLALAQAEARKIRHNRIGTEHLLLGLAGEHQGVAATVLSRLGIALNDARREVVAIVGRGEHPVQGEIKLTPRLKKVLELAVDEARRRGDTHVGTEHLLFGLLREGKGVAVQVLGRLDVSPERARAETLRVLSEAPPR
jgi:ATP-dependent Clp protease ATP-binding subunit ClpC